MGKGSADVGLSGATRAILNATLQITNRPSAMDSLSSLPKTGVT
jgi:hypothetical protein